MMKRTSVLVPAALVFAACAASGAEDPSGSTAPAPVASAAQAVDYDGDFGLSPDCISGGEHTLRNDDGAGHQINMTCEEGPGFTLDDARTLCGGPVKYFTYSCSDFPANRPYQPDNERSWTAYVGCCAGGSVGLVPGGGSEPGRGYGPGHGSEPGRGYESGHGSEPGRGYQPSVAAPTPTSSIPEAPAAGHGSGHKRPGTR
jgi:hypothetical protein